MMHGVFIGVEVSDDVASDPAVVAALAEVCPVDIFADDGGALRIVDENLDECVLCGLCEHAAPENTVRVIRRYNDAA